MIFLKNLKTMFSEDDYLGCSCGIEGIMAMNDRLNAQVLDQINDSQELVMLNDFIREINEYQFRKASQERIANIASWRWVLEDLSKRLKEAIDTLRYEQKALRVVVKRVEQELEQNSRQSKPGALCPMTDSVEDAIKQEVNFLRDQKRNFEYIVMEVEQQINSLEKTKTRIENDVLQKDETIDIERSCVGIDSSSISKIKLRQIKKQKGSPMKCWENRCTSLKNNGLKALSKAFATRHQVRGARVQLSIMSQGYAGKVDSVLRRRLHANKTKLQELIWQRDEATRDMNSLDEELKTIEQSVLENMKQEQLVEARLADRCLRPPGELTRDQVNRNLKDELGRLRHFMKNLRSNLERITALQGSLKESISRVDCCAEDIAIVVQLDEMRLRWRTREEPPADPQSSTSSPPCPRPKSSHHPSQRQSTEQLRTIEEENEIEADDDYPLPN